MPAKTEDKKPRDLQEQELDAGPAESRTDAPLTAEERAELDELRALRAEKEAQRQRLEQLPEDAPTWARREAEGERPIHHRRGCPTAQAIEEGRITPGQADESGRYARIEYIRGTRPADPAAGRPEQPTEVKRCIDCGNYVPTEGDVKEDG